MRYDWDCATPLKENKHCIKKCINTENTVAYWDQGNTSDISGTKLE